MLKDSDSRSNNGQEAHRQARTVDRPPGVYLAGFDVFRPDAVAWGRHLQAVCAEFGCVGLYPLDNQLPTGLAGAEAAAWICQANLALIRQADAVLANLNNFRGAEPDSGTAFEVGFAVALGKPVIGYLNDSRPLREQIGADQDAQGFEVEDFGLPRNLMLACTAHLVHGGLREALAAFVAQKAQSPIGFPSNL